MLRWIGRGALLGLLVGLMTAGGYIVAFSFGFMALAWGAALAGLPNRPADSAMLTLIAPAAGGLMLLCGGLLGLPPGAALGAIFGAVIGAAVGLGRRWLSPATAAALGAVITTALVALLHLWLLATDPDPTLREYIFLTIIPGLLAICAGGFVGWRLMAGEQKP